MASKANCNLVRSIASGVIYDAGAFFVYADSKIWVTTQNTMNKTTTIKRTFDVHFKRDAVALLEDDPKAAAQSGLGSPPIRPRRSDWRMVSAKGTRVTGAMAFTLYCACTLKKAALSGAVN